MNQFFRQTLPLFSLLALILLTGCSKPTSKLFNVSYDTTRELYADYNKVFQQHWKDKNGEDILIEQSHGGSGSQARAVIDGLEADVVTLALGYDVSVIADKTNLLPPDWQSKFPDNSAPYTSTIVFVVRKGNPKRITDWDDLVKPGVTVITPNPKTSGGARWNYLAAWAWAKKKYGSDQAAKDFVQKLYQHVPVLDRAARGASTTFAQRGIGDVLLSWENEAHQIERELPEKTEIVIPSVSIMAEPPVAVVTKNATKKGKLAMATEYLNYLYSEEAQDIIGKHYYRPRSAKAQAKYATLFPPVELVTIADFGGWGKAQKEHFIEGGIFDQIYGKK